MNHFRILISRPDRIGDVVLSTALPREIKKRHPESFVAVLARKYTRDIYLNNPFLDEIILLDEENSSNLKLIKKLRSRFFTHAIMLLPTERVNWILFLSGIKKRIGVGHKFYQFVTNSKSVYRRKYIPLRHEADYCADTIRKLGIEPSSINSEIYLSEEEKIKADEIKRKLCPEGELLIGINSTSGNSAPNLNPAEYRKLIEYFLPNTKIKIVVTDLVVPDELKKISGVEYINEGCNLRESIINFSVLDLLISASTGPMHICAGLKIPTLSLFCSLPATSPELWRPMGNRQDIILPDENYCKNICKGDPKNCDFSGEGGIDAGTVYNRAKKKLDI